MKFFTSHFILLLLACLCTTLLAQQFERTYGTSGHDGFYGVLEETSGNLLVYGYVTPSLGSRRALLMRVTPDGDTLAYRTYGQSSAEYLHSAAKTKDGNYIVSGTTASSGSFQAVYAFVDSSTLAISRSFKVIETTTATPRRFTHIHTLTDTSYLATGYSQDAISIEKRHWVGVVDTSGRLLWHTTIGDTAYGTFEGSSFIEDNQDTLLVTGMGKYATAHGMQIMVIKMSINGTVAWKKIYGSGPTGGDSRGYGIIQAADSGYLVSGWTNAYGAGNYDAFLLSLDRNGGIKWFKTYGTTGDDRVFQFIKKISGGYLMAGYITGVGHGGRDIFLMKVDHNGNLLWAKAYGGRYDDFIFRGVGSSRGDIYLAGRTSSYGAGGSDAYLTRANLQGFNSCDAIITSSIKVDTHNVHTGTFGVTTSGSRLQRYTYSQPQTNLSLATPCYHVVLDKAQGHLKAYPNQKTIRLQLETEKHIEGRVMMTERSDDGRLFEAIGQMRPLDGRPPVSSYSFIDTQPQSGFNHYRIKQLDAEGGESYSNVVSIWFDPHSYNKLRLYPSPMRGQELMLYSPEAISSLQVYDALGRRISLLEIQRLDRSRLRIRFEAALPAGSYFLRAYIKGKTFIQKFIIVE